jgi:ABC-type polysaccharide/polyol phosphate transport system ATPase subunit
VTVSELAPPALPPAWDEAQRDRARRPIAVAVDRAGVVFDLRLKHERSLASTLASAIRRAAPNPFWALRDIRVMVHEGDCLAIIGANGAGKSTLLQLIAGLIRPDEGSVSVRGRISSLLNLGVGFDPRLTGRENVELMGALMGLRRREVRARLPAVVDFAEIGEFIDAPLRTYSSGMRARLGFSAATAMVDPHVLLLDEVMGTGDASFREKSRERVLSLVQGAHTVVLATHDMAWVSEFATYAILLDHGRVLAEGAPAAVGTFHRARTVRPARRYACPSCGGEVPGACSTCGLVLHEPRTPPT